MATTTGTETKFQTTILCGPKQGRSAHRNRSIFDPWILRVADPGPVQDSPRPEASVTVGSPQLAWDALMDLPPLGDSLDGPIPRSTTSCLDGSLRARRLLVLAVFRRQIFVGRYVSA